MLKANISIAFLGEDSMELYIFLKFWSTKARPDDDGDDLDVIDQLLENWGSFT